MVSLISAPGALDLVTASPDAPALECGWRDGIRAKGGGRIRILGDGDDATGGFFDFHGFIELHNFPGSAVVVPNEYWRGRFSFEGGYRWHVDAQRPWTVRLTGLVEHESDHSTSPGFFGTQVDIGYVNLNALAVKGGLRHGNSAPTHAAVTARLHVLTCTRNQYQCGAGGGLRGDVTFEGEAEVGQELMLTSKWSLFAAAWAQVLVPTADIVRGRRAALRAGAIRRRGTDSLAFFFQLFGGTDVGYWRQYDTLQVGAGLAWTPD